MSTTRPRRSAWSRSWSTEFDDEHCRARSRSSAPATTIPCSPNANSILQAALGGSALATRSQAYYLDITNATANKGAAVVGIARASGRSRWTQVLTIGDGANDAPMFEVSGFSVAMGNASDAVKRMRHGGDRQ